MKQVTLNIPEDKYDFFMELVNGLGIETQDLPIPDEHKKIVLDRISKRNDKELISWEAAREIITIK